MNYSLLTLMAGVCCLAAALPVHGGEPQILLREEFAGEYNLQWDIRNADAERVSLQQNSGCLTLTSQPGSIFRTNSRRIRNQFLIANPAARGADLVCTIHIKEFKPTQKYHQTGIIFYHDDDNYLKCTAEFNDKSDEFHRIGLLAETDADVKADLEDRGSLRTNKAFWLRVIKQGRSYTSQFSHDGAEFKTTAYCEWGVGSPPWIGFMAKNVSAPDEVDVQIESFEIQDANLDPENKQLSALLRDEFDGGYALRWKVIEPDASRVSLSRKSGSLTLTTQQGTQQAGEYSLVKNIFLTANPLAQASDFQCTLRVSAFEPAQQSQQICVVLYDDADNYFEAAAGYDGVQYKISMITEDNAKAEQQHAAFEMKTPFWIRASKVGQTYLAEFSLDGKQFTSVGRAARKTRPQFMGFVAKPASTRGEADLVIDSFEITAAMKAK